MTMMTKCFCSVTIVILLSIGCQCAVVTKKKYNELGLAVTKFTIELLKKLDQSDTYDNLLVSSSHIFRLLMIAYIGSEGSASSLLSHVLNLKFQYNEIIDLYKDWNISSVDGIKESDTLFLGNDLKLKRNMKSLFREELSQVEFHDEPAVNAINKWVTKATNGKITKFFNMGERMWLLSVIVMQISWKVPFDTTRTNKDFFTMEDGTIKAVSLMYKKETTDYIRDDEMNCDILRIPYDEDELSFVVILPEKGKKIVDVIQSLTYEKLKLKLDNLKTSVKHIYLPKFTVRKDVDLIPVLEKFGLTDLFSSNTANFQKFTEEKGLFIGKVSQKVVLTVDEKGTTAVVASDADSLFLNANAVIRADHPFIYIVYNSKTKMSLLVGTMMNPEE